jgi:hypothetical protein
VTLEKLKGPPSPWIAAAAPDDHFERQSVAMVVRYEHASEERATLCSLKNSCTKGSNVVPIAESPGDRARGMRDECEVEGEVLEPPTLNSENEEKCSRG